MPGDLNGAGCHGNTSPFSSSLPSVPSLPETRRQQAADHAAAAQEVQEPDHSGLQDLGSWLHRHGRGIRADLATPGSSSTLPPFFLHSSFTLLPLFLCSSSSLTPLFLRSSAALPPLFLRSSSNLPPPFFCSSSALLSLRALNVLFPSVL